MIRHTLLSAGLLLLAVGCGRGTPAARGGDTASALAEGGTAPASLLRLPREGGAPRLYSPALEPRDWQAGGKLPALEAVIGPDADQRVVFLTDRKRNLFALELESGRTRAVLPQVTRAVVGPDGSVYAVDTGRAVTRVARRTPTRYRDRLAADPTALYPTQDGDLLAIERGRGLAIFGPDHPRQRVEEVPAGPSAATQWGDLLAVGTDTAVILFAPDANPKQRLRSVDADGPAGALLFSPSGHRLYVAETEAPALRVIGRFDRDVVATVKLPGRAVELRGDRYGDWLLARPERGDSAWVIDAVDHRLVGTVPARWGADLPAFVGAGTLVTRQGADLVALDLSRRGFPVVGTVKDGAKDLWAPVSWVPASEAPALARRDSAPPMAGTPAADSAAASRQVAAADSEGDTGEDGGARRPAERVYLQVSSSQNPDWAKDLGDQLTKAGLRAAVLPPHAQGDPYRVVVGPYDSREAAEAASRQLGRPSFIISAEPDSTSGADRQ
ncbi:MAG TPA: SPOR domain-containing protein [Gemmatimonadales bacterium]|nr:SPOR domain-containing protein [Gemmatimonadales bacterium]